MPKDIVITKAVAEKVRDTVAQGLTSGLGKPIPGQMCVEAAVCYALGLKHSDDPGCVSAPLRRLKIGLNDRAWSSPQARAEGLKRLALIQLGSRGAIDDKDFVRRVVDMTIRKAVPAALRSAAKCNPKHAEQLEAAAVRCEQEGTREACDAARATATDADAAYAYAAYAAAAYADAYVAAADAAAAYAYAYADAAADAAYAYAAYAAAAYADAYVAAAYAAADADAARARDRALAQYAEWVVEILIDMNAPGAQWLSLLEAEVA